ncbi:hypothetical protein TNCV_2249681 [Trichonephila clavipes]|nr:hypothetical protein TNCV_2249681 [Trichonephila clavipes]
MVVPLDGYLTTLEMNLRLKDTNVASSERGPCIKIPSEPYFSCGCPVSETAVSHVDAPVAWEPRIIDTTDMVVPTPLLEIK